MSEEEQKIEQEAPEPVVTDYKVPRKIWEQTLRELTQSKQQRTIEEYKFERTILPKCKGSKNIQKSLRSPLSYHTMLEMIKQAYEKKDWPNVYRIIHLAIRFKNFTMNHEAIKVS
jgi:hypothetical protein